MATPKRPPTTDRLRHDIDRGRARDKVAFRDPAAAPLGTDDEAAGTPPAPESVQLAYDLEIGRSATSADHGRIDSGVAIYVAAMIGLVISFGGLFWLV